MFSSQILSWSWCLFTVIKAIINTRTHSVNNNYVHIFVESTTLGTACILLFICLAALIIESNISSEIFHRFPLKLVSINKTIDNGLSRVKTGIIELVPTHFLSNFHVSHRPIP